MKILVVDDDPELRDALAVGFHLHWSDCQVLTAGDGRAGLRAFDEHNPDAVVLDVAMPGIGGFEVLRAIRAVSDVPVILLTHRGDEPDHVSGLDLGADAYVVKPCGYLALLARVKAVLRRADLPEPARALPDFVAGDLCLDFRRQQVTLAGRPVKLTPLEYRLLYQLVRNAGHVLPAQTLLDRVWGTKADATKDHLKVYVGRLRAKIEVPGRNRYIRTERGLGYGFVRPESASVPAGRSRSPA